MKRGHSKNKRAITPVVTTVMLILLAVILAAIIFVYRRSFLKDQIAKFNPDRGEEGPIEEVCAKVNIQASISGTTIVINNPGNIPVHKIELILDGMKIGTEHQIDIVQGGTKIIPLGVDITGKKLQLSITLLGRNIKTDQEELFLCPKEYWLQVN